MRVWGFGVLALALALGVCAAVDTFDVDPEEDLIPDEDGGPEPPDWIAGTPDARCPRLVFHVSRGAAGARAPPVV
jgi:hypothetical protein